jgi:hypothetical protein
MDAMGYCLAPGCGKEVTQGVAFCHEHFAQVDPTIRARMTTAHAQLAAARLAYAVAVADALRETEYEVAA